MIFQCISGEFERYSKYNKYMTQCIQIVINLMNFFFEGKVE